ncbi:MAG TPA: YqgE/AlgH family protein [Nitrospira sp.]|nr:YqgE/AlgH family protein [Nitrospira sp.]
MAGLLLLIMLTVLEGTTAVAEPEFHPSSVEKGVFLVASPSLNDPNFRQTVVLVLEHGPEGTLGVILNRTTDVLLSEALPDVRALKGTTHRLFAGGPVQPNIMLLLSRLKEPQPDMRSVFDSVYVGGSPDVLERLLRQAGPAARFRAFAGYAGWAPGQLGFEMLQGSWAVLPPEGNFFEKDPASLWPDSIAQLQAPRVISH